jgi:hypothetical protein
VIDVVEAASQLSNPRRVIVNSHQQCIDICR